MTTPLTPPIIEEFSHRRTGEPLLLRSLDASLEFTDAHAQQIVNVCTHPNVYNVLFAERFAGKPYTLEDAQSLARIGRTGWANGTTFIFVVLDLDQHIIGAIDIKSPNLERAEIGYWADQKRSGFMRGAVAALCEVARRAGYRSLFARVLPENERSIKVVLASNFHEEEMVHDGHRAYRIFSRRLAE